MLATQQTEASLERERQRSESEARDIIHDVGRLYTFPEERKTRWVWELIQNAKDVASPEGVDIIIQLSDNQLIFSHNGQPFATKHLLALLYKTSTKSLDGEGGTTGKYGTGFVTTHILNKKLKISGVHENSSVGKKRFELEINRSAASLDESIALKAMQDSLAVTFSAIDKISNSPAEEVADNFNSFIYELTPSSYPYAERGIQELERNLAFTLLINHGQNSKKRINSINIEFAGKKTLHNAAIIQTELDKISFISSGEGKGILYYVPSDKLIFGIPVQEKGNTFQLLPIVNQAIIFKEFPLIGTENFNLPVFIQHSDFHPTELRDGIRTKKETEETEDPTAEKNRKALLEFVSAYISFIGTIIKANLEDIHHIAKSGLPAFVENYSNVKWYKENIQEPIRAFILQQGIVKTCAGTLIEISKAKFPSIEVITDKEFYSLLARLLPSEVPNENSIEVWGEIVSQEPEFWPGQTSINQEQLIKIIPTQLDITKDEVFEWLKDLYRYLDINQLTVLGEKNPIYLNESCEFCLRAKVAIHPEIDSEFKIIARGLGRNLDKEFLHHKLGTVTAISNFELSDFYNHLNTELISKLKPEAATNDQIASIFRMCCLFKSERTSKREQWFALISQLLPHLTTEKKVVKVDYENIWSSADLWSIKYISLLLEKSLKPSAFILKYFQGHNDSAFEWLNNFLMYVFSLNSENSIIILKRKIIPTQLDEFVAYDDYIVSEQNSRYFDDSIKSIYKMYCGKGDPRRFLVDNRIKVNEIRKSEVDILTNNIDKLFEDPLIESKVKKGALLNEVFLKLNSWFEQFSDAGSYLRTFSAKRPSLYVLALGEGFSKQIMEIQNSGKSIEDITELAKIKLSPQEMKLFETAAAELGAGELLAKAKEMLDAKQQIDRWKKIGTAAENAFEETMASMDFDYKIENPDRGKDFDLIINTKGYAIEIKNVTEGKENVRMSILQGRTAVKEKDFYALCVMTRPNDDMVIDIDYFKAASRFVMDIGYKIGDKIEKWDSGLRSLELDADIKVSLVDKTESVYINRDIWKNAIPFEAFIIELKKILSVNEVD